MIAIQCVEVHVNYSNACFEDIGVRIQFVRVSICVTGLVKVQQPGSDYFKKKEEEKVELDFDKETHQNHNWGGNYPTGMESLVRKEREEKGGVAEKKRGGTQGHRG